MTDKNPHGSLKPIIAFCGAIGAGKTYAAEVLANRDYEHLSWANKVKETCASIWGLPLGMLNGKFPSARKWRETECPDLTAEFGRPMTPRMLLQQFGTDACRAWHSEIWVKACMREVRMWNASATPVVLDDTRFPNEAQAVRDRGGIVVRIVRPGNAIPAGADTTHASEAGIPDTLVDHALINDGTPLFKDRVLELGGYPPAEPLLTKPAAPAAPAMGAQESLSDDGGDFLAGSKACDLSFETCESCQ